MTPKSLLRIATIIALGLVAAFGIFSEPLSETSIQWIIDVLWTKSLGFSAVYAIIKLYKHWCKIDPWFAAYDKKCVEAFDTPNPMYIDNE